MRGLLVVPLVVASVGCSSSRQESQGSEPPVGRLCLGANPADVFAMPEGAPPNIWQPGTKRIAIRVHDVTVAVPNEAVTIGNLKTGETVEVVIDGEVAESFRVDLGKHGDRLCYYFRKYEDLTRTAGWILDADRAQDRCECW